MQKRVVSRTDEGRGAPKERGGKYPTGGLRVRPGHEITKIINGEEIIVLDPLIRGYVSGIIPSEIATPGNGTKSWYHIGVGRDRHRAERRQAQNVYFPHRFCRVRPSDDDCQIIGLPMSTKFSGKSRFSRKACK